MANLRKTLFFFFLWSTLGFLGCSTVNQELNKNLVYRADMALTVNGQKYVGVGSIPKSPNRAYEISVQSKGDMDYFVLRTCHREWTSEDEGDKKKILYYPQWPIEQDSCPAEIEGLNKKNKHSFSFITFQEDSKTLPARQIKCNGNIQENTLGVSVCQAGAGLIQYIEFDNEVVLSDAGDPNCKLEDINKVSKSFQFKMKPGRCVYTFMETSGEKRRHRFWTRGYGAVILTEL